MQQGRGAAENCVALEDSAGATRQRIQMVLLRESGLTQPAIVAGLGVSLSTVTRAHMGYGMGGIKALRPRPLLCRGSLDRDQRCPPSGPPHAEGGLY
jgi:hypothetical protein